MLDISERSEPERAGMSTIGVPRLALGLVLPGVVLLAIGLGLADPVAARRRLGSNCRRW